MKAGKKKKKESQLALSYCRSRQEAHGKSHTHRNKKLGPAMYKIRPSVMCSVPRFFLQCLDSWSSGLTQRLPPVLTWGKNLAGPTKPVQHLGKEGSGGGDKVPPCQGPFNLETSPSIALHYGATPGKSKWWRGKRRTETSLWFRAGNRLKVVACS